MPSSKKPRQAGTTVTAQEALDFHARGRPGKLEILGSIPGWLSKSFIYSWVFYFLALQPKRDYC